MASAPLWWLWYHHTDPGTEPLRRASDRRGQSAPSCGHNSASSAGQLIWKDEPLGDIMHHRRPFVPVRTLPVKLLLCKQAHITFSRRRGYHITSKLPTFKIRHAGLVCAPNHVSHFSLASKKCVLRLTWTGRANIGKFVVGIKNCHMVFTENSYTWMYIHMACVSNTFPPKEIKWCQVFDVQSDLTAKGFRTFQMFPCLSATCCFTRQRLVGSYRHRLSVWSNSISHMWGNI